jgi:hypothetical protein
MFNSFCFPRTFLKQYVKCGAIQKHIMIDERLLYRIFIKMSAVGKGVRGMLVMISGSVKDIGLVKELFSQHCLLYIHGNIQYYY